MKGTEEYYQHVDYLEKYCLGGKESKGRSGWFQVLYKHYREFFGSRILDLACGGGILGAVIGEDHEYVGVDINKDMIRKARETVGKAPSRRFIRGDITKQETFEKIQGTFDTFTFLGNSFCHFTTGHFLKVLKNIDSLVQEGAYFIFEFRDVVKMLYEDKWKEKLTVERPSETVPVETTSCDTEQGAIHQRTKGEREIKFIHGIWSPFILETLMNCLKWAIIKRKRKKDRPESVTEVYKKSKPGEVDC